MGTFNWYYSGYCHQRITMKLTLFLLAILPLVYCATIEVDLDKLTDEQKRFLFKLPSLDDVKNAICSVMSSDAGHTTCDSACQVALSTIPYGSLAGSLCGPACNSIHC